MSDATPPHAPSAPLATAPPPKPLLQLLDYLARRNYLRSPAVRAAMEAVDRRAFVPRAQHYAAYDDTPLPIGRGQTISAPHMVAMMLEALAPQPGERLLEIGSGCGYHAAVASRMVLGQPAAAAAAEAGPGEAMRGAATRAVRRGAARDDGERGPDEAVPAASSEEARPAGSAPAHEAQVGQGGEVHTVERIAALAEMARANLAGYANVTVHHADGSLGLPALAPFERIMVTCGAPAVPGPLLAQLAVGGRMVVPVGGRTYQDLVIVDHTPGGFRESRRPGVAFVPLIGAHGFPG